MSGGNVIHSVLYFSHEFQESTPLCPTIVTFFTQWLITTVSRLDDVTECVCVCGGGGHQPPVRPQCTYTYKHLQNMEALDP